MQLNGLGQYQSNALVNPWGNPVAQRSKSLAAADPSASGAATAAQVRTGGLAPLAPLTAKPAISTNGKLNIVDGMGDQLSVAATTSTRAEVRAANATSQTAQAAVTTANAVDDSLAKTGRVLAGMRNIVSQLAVETVSQSQRAELTHNFGRLAGGLDTLAATEIFAGHRTLDGNFRATFSVGDSVNPTKVTVDATLPNGKAFNSEGLGVTALAAGIVGAANNPAAASAAAKQATLGLAIASGAVNQVRSSVQEAAASALNALQQSSPLMSSGIGGSAQLAQSLVAKAVEGINAQPTAAFRAQANMPASMVQKLFS